MPSSSVRMFTETLCKWCAAVEAGNATDALFYAGEAAVTAEILAIRPEFWQTAGEPGVTPEEAARRAKAIGTFLEACSRFATTQQRISA